MGYPNPSGDSKARFDGVVDWREMFLKMQPSQGRAWRGQVLVAVFAALLAALLAGPSLAQEGTTPAGEQIQQVPGEAIAPPEIEAGAWALVDARSGRYLAGQNQDERLPLGSTTKIMSTLVIFEMVETGELSLDEEVVISTTAEQFVGTVFSNVGLIAGETVTVQELMEAALVPSGTEAVYALAEYAGGGGGEASVERFAGLMNAKAEEMSLRNSRFDSPAGLDSPENYSSARDMAAISREAMSYPEFRELVDQTEATITTDTREIETFSTNALLNIYPPATGIKTGTSPEGGPSLVASAEEGEEAYISVVLDAVSEDGFEGDRFADSQTILDYGFANYEREALATQDEVYGEIDVPFRRDETVDIAAAEVVTGLVSPGASFERRVTTQEPPPSARLGQELGEVEVLVDGQSVGSSPLVATQGYEEASFWQKTWFRIRGLFG